MTEAECTVLATQVCEALGGYDGRFYPEDIEKVARVLAASPHLQWWQPIATAPKDGTPVIGALIRDGKIWRVHDMKHNGLAFYTTGQSLPQMTHWTPMPPLPAPPGEPPQQ